MDNKKPLIIAAIATTTASVIAGLGIIAKKKLANNKEVIVELEAPVSNEAKPVKEEEI